VLRTSPIGTRRFVDLHEQKSDPEALSQVFDPEIVKKWREETIKGSVQRPVEEHNENDQESDEESKVEWEVTWTDAMFDYCIAELQHVAKNVYPTRKDGALIVFNGCVVKSDLAVSESIKTALQTAVKPLEDVPEKEKDWHPGSKGLVLDLVHPSLFPLVYGKTRVIKEGEVLVGLEDCISRCGEGDVPVTELRYKTKYQPYSDKFQWLPCEVDISGNNGSRYASRILASDFTPSDKVVFAFLFIGSSHISTISIHMSTKRSTR